MLTISMPSAFFRTLKIKFYTRAIIIVLVFSFINCKEEKNNHLNLSPYSVGHIPFSEKTDNPDFKLCKNGYIIENGGRRPSYKGGIKKIWKYFQPTLDELKYKKGENGYLTIRFITNCKGEKDRFRALAINERYKPKEFPEHITQLLLNAVKIAPDWQIPIYKGKKYDGYNMLTFKIKNGLAIDIIP